MSDDRGRASGADPREEGREVRFLERFKEFRAASFAIEHRTSVMVLLGIIVIMGVLSYRSTPKESFPEIAIPIIAVNTMYPGVSPKDVESQVTRQLEDELSTISDLDELTSTSVEGYSSIAAKFKTSVNLEDALQKVREKVDLAKGDLPDDAEEPSIVEFNFSEIPIMSVNLSGEYGLVRLKDLGEDMKDRLEQIPSVLRADVRGGLEREVKVDVDLAKLKFYGLGLQDVVDAVRNENVNIPGGSIDVGDSKYLVRVDGEFEDPSLIGDLVVKMQGGRPIYVRDVADVDFGFAERDSYARMNGNEVVTIDDREALGREHHRDGQRGAAGHRGDAPDVPAHDPGEHHRGHVRPDREDGVEPREQHPLRAHPDRRRPPVLPGRVELDVRGDLDPVVHAPELHRPEAAGRVDEHGGAVQPHPRPGDAGGQRHRGGGEHLPLPGGGLGPHPRGQEGHGRGGDPRHRVHRDDAGGVRAAACSGPARRASS